MPFLEHRWRWAVAALWFSGACLAHSREIFRLYLCLSGFVFIFTNLGKREPGTLSAYSVFNPNFEELPGTLTASQFEAEIRRQPMGDRANQVNHAQRRRNEDDDGMTEQERRDLQRALELSIKEAEKDEKRRRKAEGKRGKKKRGGLRR